MPRLKYDRDTLHRMLSQVAKSQKAQIVKPQVELEPSKMLKRISQHCVRCGKVTIFSIDQLGFATCTKVERLHQTVTAWPSEFDNRRKRISRTHLG